MNIQIDKRIFEKYPEVQIGVVVVKGINNSQTHGKILEMIKQQEKEIRAQFSTETLSEHSKIAAWRKAYSLFGVKPKKYKSSVENLYRMILNDISLRHINTIVDIYNYISIKHILPVGGDDIDKIDGDITLTFAQGNETFKELNSDEIKNPKGGEVVYKDEKEILCRRWNWRECDKSKKTTNTTNIALLLEGFISKEEMQKIVTELSELVREFCGGEIKTHILNNSLAQAKIN